MTPLRARCTDAAPDGWSALLEHDAGATPAHRPELWQAFAAALPGMTVRFIAVEDKGAFAGGAAVLLERRAGLTWLHALPYLLSGAPLARPAFAAAVDAAVGEALAELQRAERAVGGEWSCYRADGAPVAAAALERVNGETRLFEMQILDLASGFEEARRRVDRKTRQALAHTARSGLSFDEEPDALEEAVALNARQSRRWRAHRPAPIELSRRLIEGGAARLFAVRDARGLLCATLALDGGRETLLWWSGARDESRAQGAYAHMVWSLAGWAAARGRARLNLGASTGLGPVAVFKRSLGARPVRFPVRWMSARFAPPLGRLTAALQTRLRRGRARGEAA